MHSRNIRNFLKNKVMRSSTTPTNMKGELEYFRNFESSNYVS